LIVNLTSWRHDREQACILHSGDHPFVTHDTCINYRQSRLVAPEQLQQAFARGALTGDAPVGADVLQRIREGAAQSKLIPLQNLDLLKRQGLVE
jgi:hypothetical protein